MIVNEGLGDTSKTIAQTVPTLLSAAGSAGTSILVGAGVVGAHAAAGTFAASSLAVPIIGVAIAGVTLVVGMWLSNIAKHNTEKTAATKIVNEAEPYLKQNVDAFLGMSNPTQADKDQALTNFDGIWAQVVQACGNASLEDAGVRCISERSAGGKWDWVSYYRTPIVNRAVSANVFDTSGLFSSSSGSNNLLLYAGLGLVALMFVAGSKGE